MAEKTKAKDQEMVQMVQMIEDDQQRRKVWFEKQWSEMQAVEEKAVRAWDLARAASAGKWGPSSKLGVLLPVLILRSQIHDGWRTRTAESCALQQPTSRPSSKRSRGKSQDFVTFRTRSSTRSLSQPSSLCRALKADAAWRRQGFPLQRRPASQHRALWNQCLLCTSQSPERAAPRAGG